MSQTTFNFNNQCFLVTGANSGTGLTCCKLVLESNGELIAFVHDDQSALDQLLNSNQLFSERTLIYKVDLADSSDVASRITAAIKAKEQIHHLINCVGRYFDGDEWDKDEAAWKKTFITNLFSALNISKHIGEHFKKYQQGTMIHIASRMGVLGCPDSVMYSASKAGLINLTQSYARLLAPFGTANVISPAAMNAGYWIRAPKSEVDATISASPMHRLIDVSEVAKLAVYLSSDDARSITGQNIQIDAGYSIR